MNGKHLTHGTAFLILGLGGIAIAALPEDYKGSAYSDSVYKDGPQPIPGRLQAAYFDLGGEGVAYRDADRVNQGSGRLNYDQKCPDQADPRVCHFRERESVDLSYTKSCCDFTSKNLDVPERKQFYVGWQAKGEWLNYTVRVKAAGAYKIRAMYANGAQTVSFDVNRVQAAVCRLPVNTGGPHVWKYADSIGVITFADTGIHLLTYHIADLNNTAYFDFAPVAGNPAALSHWSKAAGTGLELGINRVGRKAGIRFTLGQTDRVRLSVLDASGSTLLALPWKTHAAGPHLESIDLQSLGTGALYLQVEHGGMATVKPLPALP